MSEFKAQACFEIDNCVQKLLYNCDSCVSILIYDFTLPIKCRDAIEHVIPQITSTQGIHLPQIKAARCAVPRGRIEPLAGDVDGIDGGSVVVQGVKQLEGQLCAAVATA